MLCRFARSILFDLPDGVGSDSPRYNALHLAVLPRKRFLALGRSYHSRISATVSPYRHAAQRTRLEQSKSCVGSQLHDGAAPWPEAAPAPDPHSTKKTPAGQHPIVLVS